MRISSCATDNRHSMKRFWTNPHIMFLLVIASVTVAYLPGLSNGFVWLDHTEIVDGLRIVHHFSDVPSLFLFDDHGYSGYHRPFYNLLHSFDFYLWGLNPFGFHLSSLVLHLVNIALVWVFLGRVGSVLWLRLVICLLWGLHPINTAAVGLIHARADLFATTMLCLTLLCLDRACLSEQSLSARGWRSLAFICFCVAILTKEIALTLPIGLTILALSNFRKRLRLFTGLTPWLLMSYIACGTVIVRRSLGGSLGDPKGDLFERLLTFATVYNEYFLSVLLPQKLFIGDTVNRFSALDISSQITGLAVGVILLGIQATLFIKSPWSRPWLLTWNLALVPVSQIIPILHFRADRFLYLPSLGLIGLVAEACVRAVYSNTVTERWLRGASVVVVGLIAFNFGMRTAVRLRDFKTDESLFSKELRHTPDYREGLSALALSYYRHGEYTKADKLWRTALKPLVNKYSYLHLDAAIVNYSANLLGQNRFREAYLFLKPRISQINENSARDEARYNFAIAASYSERFNEAFPILLEYVIERSDDALAHYLLGWTSLNLGDVEQARVAFNKYLELSPNARNRAQVENWISELKQR